MADARVALTRVSDYGSEKISHALSGQFELLGGLGKFVSRGDVVLIKPNLIAPRSRRVACVTDGAVILETARLLKDFGAKPFVGDSPAWSNTYNCIERLKLTEALRDLGVGVRQLDRGVKCDIDGAEVGISSVALEADVIVNLPKLKSHQQLVATFAVKNMFGVVCGKKKAYWHFARGGTSEEFTKFLIAIYRYVNPAVTIIDGVVAMDGPGPIRGRARPLGWLVGGTDAIACEVVCCKLIGYEPDKLPMVQTAKRVRFGQADMGKIKLVGDSIGGWVCRDFEIPAQIPVKFSLLRVMKSIFKQIWLLVKGRIWSKSSD